MTHLAVVVGSLRRESFSRQLAHALLAAAPAGVTGTEVPIGDLALYNQDFDTDGTSPPAYATFRAAIKAADAVLFVTPEYNRSVPGALKNALDVGSRPYGQSVWAKKPAAVISCSPGVIGGFGANHALRQSLVFLDMPILQQPEAYIGNVTKVLDEPDSSREFLTKIMAAFASWIGRTRG
jgi:chromate reductase